MIIYKYIFKEILKVQIVTTIILLTVFLSQSTIKYIGRATVGRVPVDIVSSMVAYSIPSIAFIMLPLTLFIAVLVAVGRISSDSEMVVLRSVGFSGHDIVKIALFLAFFTAVVTGINSLYFMPQAAFNQKALLNDAQSNLQYLPIESGRFSNFANYIIYVQKVDENNKDKSLGNVVVISSPLSGSGSIAIAKAGNVSFDKEGVQWLHMQKGKSYQGPVEDGSYRVSSFEELSIPVRAKSEDEYYDKPIAGTPTLELLSSDSREFKLELQWRLAPIFAVFILTLVAVPLSMTNPRQGRFSRLGPAMAIYVSYYLILLALYNLLNSTDYSLVPGLYIVPVFFLIFVVLPLNFGNRFHTLARRK